MSTAPTMSLHEAAETLKIHPHTLEKMIRAGEIPAGKPGRAYVLMTRDVLAFAEKVILQHTADRLIAAGKTVPARGSPHRRRQVASAQVGIAH